MKRKALQIYKSAINRVLPDKLVRSGLLSYDSQLKNAQNIYILAFGKAAFLMAKEAEIILSDKITGGLVITKHGHGGELKYLKVIEAGHPIPDKNGVNATIQILKIAEQAKENDVILCLISGGASALLADYPENATLNDLRKANDLLISSGASISEINSVRKHISGVKGGQLAKAIFPAITISLILSDVVGDNVEVIASGPTAPDNTTYSDALEVIKKYNLEDFFPTNLKNHIQKGRSGLIPENPEQDDPIFRRVQNKIIGNNLMALEGASEKATALGFNARIITHRLEGDYTNVAEYILNSINARLKENNRKPHCLLFGGEPTVKLTGSGRGGRNQHLALYLATKITGTENITILCAGTDGTDGSTDAVGAIIDGNTINKAKIKGISPNPFLSEFNSYNFFSQTGDLIKTGNTGTNVMDLVIVLCRA